MLHVVNENEHKLTSHPRTQCENKISLIAKLCKDTICQFQTRFARKLLLGQLLLCSGIWLIRLILAPAVKKRCAENNTSEGSCVAIRTDSV